MAITSFGYDGTITETQWAKLASVLGSDSSGVIGAGDWAVTAVSAANQSVAVATGSGYGWGVYDTSDAQVTLQLGTIASGSRWDLIAMRRNWAGTGGTSSFVVVAGTSTAVIPSGRNINPGALADQPLALVQVTAGQTVPTAIIDLRVWASKVFTASTSLALPDTQFNDEAVISGVRYRRDVNGQWVSTKPTLLATQDWHWGSAAYAFPIPSSGAGITATGASRTVNVVAGNRYSITSLYSAHATNTGIAGTFNGRVAVANTILRTAKGYVSYGNCEDTHQITGYYEPASSGSVTFATQFFTSVAGIEVFGDPTSYIIDHGPI